MTTTKERHQGGHVKFAMGLIVITPEALAVLDLQEVQSAIMRHGNCDWGDVGREDQLANERALKNEGRLCSVFHAANSRTFWIVTEGDRSVTTILLAVDY